MKVLVLLRQVADLEGPPRVRADRSGVDLTGVKRGANPYDEVALEAALRLRDSGSAAEVVAVAAGPAGAGEMLRGALAMGADRAIHLLAATDDIGSPALARRVAEIALAEEAGLVLLGRQRSDDEQPETAPMLAGVLGWGQGIGATGLAIDGEDAVVTLPRNGGRRVLRLRLPAVVATELRLAQPRIVSMKGIVAARKKAIIEVGFGAGLESGVRVLTVAPAPARKPGIRVGSAAELVERLRGEGVLP